MLQPAGVGSWSEDDVNAVWRAVLGKWARDDVRAALVCAYALTLGLSAEDVLGRVAASEVGTALPEGLEWRGDSERERSPKGRKRALGVTDRRHGTTVGYEDYGCRCEKCKVAARAEG
jgi:hypothetical protein